ncbi:unnamed protein product [Prunus brigantina]
MLAKISKRRPIFKLNTKGSLFSSDSLSPHSILMSTTPKFQTVFSGKQVIEFSKQSVKQEQVPAAQAKRVHGHGERNRSRRRVGPSKSLSDLEFDELKGYMDLGFVFTEEDKDSKLVCKGLEVLGNKIEMNMIREIIIILIQVVIMWFQGLICLRLGMLWIQEI